MKLPTLFKKTSTGKIEQWTIWVEPSPLAPGAFKIVTEHGHVDGKLQRTAEVVAEGKNLGKANATTAEQQAQSQAESEWTTKKTRKGYVEDLARAQAGDNDGAGGIRPMLAQAFSKHGDKLTFPCYAQPKLDGIRCIATVNAEGHVHLWSREQKPITAVPHINRAVAELRLPAGTVLDGELYRHVTPEKGVEVELSKGLRAVVSEEDVEEIEKYKWSASTNGYAVRATPRSEGKEMVYMHRQLLDAPDGFSVDHINGNKLDNRRTNLRLCTTSQNLANSKVRKNSQSGLKGVYFFKRDQNWQAQITVNNQKIHLGYFNTPEEAAAAYDVAAKKHFGEFARTNANANGDFEKIVSALRKVGPADPKLAEMVQYHVYDLPRHPELTGAKFSDRAVKLALIIPETGPLVRVETDVVHDKDALLEIFDRHRAQGYEGAMARNNETAYEEGKRSYSLLKLKEFDEAEFPIVGVEEGVGKMAGLAIFVCLANDNDADVGGNTFRCKMEGSLEGLRKYLEDESTWRGKRLTIKYQGLTGKAGVPRFPVGKAVRDYE